MLHEGFQVTRRRTDLSIHVILEVALVVLRVGQAGNTQSVTPDTPWLGMIV